MSSVIETKSSHSMNYDWNYRMNRLNDQIAERFRRDETFNAAEGSSPRRVNSGSRNLGYDYDEERVVNNRRALRMSDDMEQRYNKNRESHYAGYRGQFVDRSRMYQIPNDEDRTRSYCRNYYQEVDEKGYRKTEFRKERRHDRHQYQEMDELGHRETELGKSRSNDSKYYQEIDETGYRETEFRKERRDNRSYCQDMDDETGHRETEFCNAKAVDGNGRAHNNMRYIDRGLNHPKKPLNYPEPNAQYIDRGSDFPQSNMQCQPGTSAWNTQAPFTVQYPLVGEPKGQKEKEKKKPRKRWWYTTSRIFSALLIITSVVSDWVQFEEMQGPIGKWYHTVKDPFTSKVHTVFDTLTMKNCSEKSQKDETGQFWYLTVAGTVLAGLQFVNIIYQIVQNHRLPIDTDIKDYIDERTEVFLVNTFIKFPQMFLIHRYEVNLCLVCDTGYSKKVKGLLNGLSSVASTVWRYLTHLKTSSCSNMCKICAERCGNCIKSCLLGCIKCLCPTRYCCIELKNLFPCCFMHLIFKNICQCKCDPKKPSILAELASIPTGFVAFLYGLRIAKFFCVSKLSDVITFVFDDVIGYVWNFVFHNK